MKRLLLLLSLLAFSSFYSTSYAQRVRIPCPTTLNDINDCPDNISLSAAVVAQLS